MIAGKKQTLINKLIKHRQQENGKISIQRKMKEYLEPKERATNENQPILTNHYRTSFSAIDKFSQRLGYVEYPHRIGKKSVKILISLLLMASVNTWTIETEMKIDHEEDNSKETFKEYLASLYKHMF